MKLKGIVILFACLLFLAMPNCQADERKDEWKSPNFNFGNIKTILLTTSNGPNAKPDEFDVRKLENFYSEIFLQNEKRWNKRNLRFITLNQLKDRISTATGENMQQLEMEDQVRYKAQMDSFTPIIVDAILNIKVTSFGYDQRFVPEYSYTRTEQIEKEIDTEYQDSNGKWIRGKKKIKEPILKTITTPAHYDTYANAGMDCTLVNAKTNETIWMLRDVREAYGKEPIHMTERILNRAADSILKI